MAQPVRITLFRLFVATAVATLGTLVAARAMAFDNGDVLIGTSGGSARLDDATATEPLLVAIDTPYQVFADAGTLVHVAAWSPDGRPAAGAEVFLSGHFVGRADDTGTFAFRWGVPGNDVEDYWTSGSRVEVRWRDGQHGVRAGQVWFNAFSRTESYESDHLYVYTDRGVYAPGDTLRSRLIAWHLAADYAPVEGHDVELTLVGPDGTTITGATATTDAFGVAWAELALSDTLPDGVYALSVAYQGASASTRVRVERFVPPVIAIEHTLGRFLTRDVQELAWEVSLRYVEGGAPHSAVVSVDAIVRGETRYSHVARVEGPGPHAFAIAGEDLAVVTDGLSDRERFDVRITVEDDLGRVDRLTRDLTFAANPYVAVIEADRDAWSEGDPIELIARVTDVERVPVRDTELRLLGSDGAEWTARTDAAGTAQFTLRMGDRGFDVSLFVPGVDSPVATRWLDWQEPQPMRSHIADAIVRENEPAHVRVTFPAGFHPAERVVHMDVTDISGSLVNAVLLPIREDDGAFVAEGSFSAPSWGSMLLTFFCLGEGPGADPLPSELAGAGSPLGLMTEGQNLAVHPGRELSIVLDGVPDTLEPGAGFRGAITVRDGDGRRVDAAIGIAMVDEGVIALKDPLEITPMDHFYNPELRVISTTGSAILTWPVVSRNWGFETHDIALPPFPFKAGGPIQSAPDRAVAADEAFDAMEGEMGATGYGGGAGFGAGMAGSAAAMPMMMQESDGADHFVAEEADLGGLADLEDAGLERRSRSDGRPAGGEPGVTIAFRTERPDTSLWVPDLRADDGRATLRGSVPDAITRQQITLVASDARGGVGVLRASVDVTRPLSVRSDLPATIRRGETVQARVAATNRTDAAREVVLAIHSDDLQVLGEPVTVTVGPGQTASTTIGIVAPRAGDARFAVSGTSGTLSDGVEETVRVLPSGTRSQELHAGVVTSGDPFDVALDAAPDAEWREATLSVTFPALTSAFAGVDLLLERIATQPVEQLAGDVVTAMLVFERQRDAGGPDVERWRSRLQGAVDAIQRAQQDDGGWRVWWDDGSSVFLTAWCLEALTEAHRLDFVVDTDRVRRAAEFVVGALERGPVRLTAIDFWEGDSAAVEAGVRAEALHVLARVPVSIVGDGIRERTVALVRADLPVLDADAPELLAFAHTLGAAAALGRSGDRVLAPERERAAVERLVALRREGHWEPSWFNAYGGTIEATVTVLEVLGDLGGDAVDRVARDALRYLMSTSDALGSWHNESGSAWLLRGLALVAAPAPDAAATVRIVVDGDEVDRVTVDPADPYQSALRLRAVDLSGYARAGATRFAVTYDGSMAPRVELVDSIWR